MRITRKSAIIICELLLGSGILFSPTITWDGGFRVAEYRIRLQDESGESITNVTMDVAGADGASAYQYPILEFNSGTPVNPRDDGTFVVHQVRSGFQFGGNYMLLFGVLPIGRKGPPTFTITFRDVDSVIHETEFSSLDDGFDYSAATRVKRTFTVGEVIYPQHRDKLNSEELDEVAIEAEFPVIERTFTVRPDKQDRVGTRIEPAPPTPPGMRD